MAQAATAIEIDKKLRDDFQDRLKKYGVETESKDPVLAVLFRSFAQQLGTLYSGVGHMRLALLDELIGGLGMQRRAARPAQTVVRFILDSGERVIQSGTELIGETESGERLVFRTDAGIAISAARLALALVYEKGSVRLLSGIDLPERLQAARPSLDPVRATLGPNPAIWLAFEGMSENHLSRSGVFFEIGPDGLVLEQALATEPWCLAGRDGELSSAGILRPHPAAACVQRLDWLVQPAYNAGTDEEIEPANSEAPALTSGFYGPKAFVLPAVPPSCRFTCQIPKLLGPPIQRIFGRDTPNLFREPRAWLRIGLPSAVTGTHSVIGSIFMHAITASNVECLNQTIHFDREGLSFPVSREAGTSSFLLAPISVVGESGSEYVPEMQPSPDLNAGRYLIRNGRMELRPPQAPGGYVDKYANVRLWVTEGALGNRVGPGQVHAFSNPVGYSDLRIVNPTAAAGGADVETFETAQARFAQALLSRDRIVTRDDLMAAVYAFDRRIRDVRIERLAQRSPRGLQRAHRVTVWMNRADFVDGESESRILRDDLNRLLRSRTLFDTELSIELEWR
jgi:hypothetical protein